jgi:RNA chaperone Hfq
MNSPNTHSNKKPQDFKNGHQTILKTLIRENSLAVFDMLDGTQLRGQVTQFDNYTITITRHSDGQYRTIFKSAIKCFGACNV